ncbi:MAG TPA: cysteine desulfurase [Geobacterales bacterium]|nr:cysteine desulfurase [Geobacterales bacterium]
MLDKQRIQIIKKDFPILNREVNEKKLVYLDNAATTQKPIQVIEAIRKYYEYYNANVHRGVYTLAEEATAAYEESRKEIVDFINANSYEEIIFVRNATEAINLVAYAWGRKFIKEGDKIVVSQMEHHSNLIPWQILSREKKAKLEFIGITEEGKLNEEDFNKIDKKTKLVAITHVSNVLGTINRVEEITKIAHELGALVLVDGAQSVPHMPVDVKKIDCDFLAFSGHKMLGPMGIGVLFAKREILEEMPPFLTGGEMIKNVDFYESTWNDLPWKYEAGTPNVEGAIGLAEAIRYLKNIGMENIRAHEKALVKLALSKLSDIKGLVIYGPKDPEIRGGVISFNLGNIHAHDVASILDQEGVQIRAGHHCAKLVMKKFNVPAMARASFYLYNDEEDIDALYSALNVTKKVFGLD